MYVKLPWVYGLLLLTNDLLETKKFPPSKMENSKQYYAFKY